MFLKSEGAWTPGEAGGLWGDDARGINEGGLEVRQLIERAATRVRLRPEAEIEGVTEDDVIGQILETVEVPRT